MTTPFAAHKAENEPKKRSFFASFAIADLWASKRCVFNKLEIFQAYFSLCSYYRKQIGSQAKTIEKFCYLHDYVNPVGLCLYYVLMLAIITIL